MPYFVLLLWLGEGENGRLIIAQFEICLWHWIRLLFSCIKCHKLNRRKILFFFFSMLCCFDSQWVLGKEMRREHEEAEGISCSYKEEDCKGNHWSAPWLQRLTGKLIAGTNKYMTATPVSDAAQVSLTKTSLKFRVHPWNLWKNLNNFKLCSSSRSSLHIRPLDPAILCGLKMSLSEECR